MSYTGGFTSEQKNKQEVKSMKKLLVLLSAILLIFAIGCSNDNPAPDGGTLPEIPDSAPQDYTSVPEEDRAGFVSTALGFFSAIFQEEDVQKLMMSDEGGSNDEGTLSVSVSQTGDTATVDFHFDGFVLSTLAQQIGKEVTLWGGYSTTGLTSAPDMSDNTFSFNVVVSISEMGIYHLSGRVNPSQQKVEIYLNGDLVEMTNQPQ